MATETKGKGKASSGGAKSTRRARGGLAAPVRPDPTLARVVGKDPMTRAALTKVVWDYVKTNDLQDPKDRRTIQADDNLRPVFGGKDRVSMFEMTKLVNEHVSPA